MRKTFGDYFLIIFSITASIATLVGFYQTYYKGSDDQGKYGIIFLGIISLWLLSNNIYLVQKFRKKVGYAEVFQELNLGYMNLHSLDRNTERDPKGTIQGLKSICSNISNAFKEVKGDNIGVCIKLISLGKDGRAKVITLCRDERSTQSRPIGVNDKIEHWLTENSDFNFINQNIENDSNRGHFYSNNLPYSFDYSNTRLKSHADWPPKKFGLLLRFFNWPLKYKSTIVVPIIPLGINDRETNKIRGFLCIDSDKTSTFNERYDVEILKGISDGLYNQIDKLQKDLA